MTCRSTDNKKTMLSSEVKWEKSTPIQIKKQFHLVWWNHVDEVRNQSFLIHKSYKCFEIMAEKVCATFRGGGLMTMNWER
jgi:hypothetical protein